VGMWRVFEKAGQPGWAAIIPIYNIIVLCQIADKPVWWFLVYCCVPCIGPILLGIAVAEKFGQGAGFGIGLGLLGFIFYPLLGLGSYVCEGGSGGGGRGRRPRRRAEEEEDDEDEDDDDDRPRRRARDEDDEDEDEDDDRPKKKRRDEDDDDDEDDRRVKRRR